MAADGVSGGDVVALSISCLLQFFTIRRVCTLAHIHPRGLHSPCRKYSEPLIQPQTWQINV